MPRTIKLKCRCGAEVEITDDMNVETFAREWLERHDPCYGVFHETDETREKIDAAIDAVGKDIDRALHDFSRLRTFSHFNSDFLELFRQAVDYEMKMREKASDKE